MPEPETVPIFDSVNDTPCETFIRAVRKHALAEGREKDDTWIAHYAAASMDGLALRWYEELEEEDQESWKLLRRAMLRRWPPPPLPKVEVISSPGEPPALNAIPTPAAAPPRASSPAPTSPLVPSAPAMPPPPTPPVSPPTVLDPIRRPTLPARQRQLSGSNLNTDPGGGRLRLVDAKTKEPYGFIAKSRNPRGCYELTTEPAKALVVNFSDTSPLQTMMSDTQATIGLIWIFSGRVDIRTVEHSLLTKGVLSGAMTELSRGPMGQWVPSTSRSHQGIVRPLVWNVTNYNRVTALWESFPSRVLYPLEIAITRHPGHDDDWVIQLAPSMEKLGYEAGRHGFSYTNVSMVFDPL